MKIGMIGLGKLGLPVALAVESRGHEVMGYDLNPDIGEIISSKKIPYCEPKAQELIANTKIQFVERKTVVKWADIIFVAVQTPHEKEFEGITRLSEERKDFDYSFLRQAIADISYDITRMGLQKTVVIISTVLPGTIRREIMPILSGNINLIYNPLFIAMGTVVEDFLNPEFVLLGVSDTTASNIIEQFYSTIHNAPIRKMSIESAELTKVSYNTYITAKICIANNIMEVCHRTGANCDDVIGAIKMADRRIVSTAYMGAGGGDGGGCHGRDNIALSWLSRELGMNYNIYDSLMRIREKQTEFLSDLIQREHKDDHSKEVIILGYSFKAGVNIVTGSYVLLLMSILDERGIRYRKYDPYVDRAGGDIMDRASIYFIGTNHRDFITYDFKPRSVIIDPWRYLGHIRDVKYIGVGQNNKKP
jgi:UDPglucose 6-dehydrogenase